MTRGATRRPAPPRSRLAPLVDAAKRRPAVTAVAAAALLALVWWFWPSGLGNVKNLDSRGSAIVAFGDSLTAGYGAAPDEAYPAVLSRKMGVEVVNAGVSGDTTEAAALRLDRDVLALSPRLVIVGLGGNDFLRSVPIAVTEETLRGIVRRIQAGGAMVVLLGFEFPSLTANYGAMYERIADEEGCLLVPDLLDGILTRPELKSDEIHPNGRGYELLATRIAGPCAKLLARADAARR